MLGSDRRETLNEKEKETTFKMRKQNLQLYYLLQELKSTIQSIDITLAISEDLEKENSFCSFRFCSVNE